jgi:diguanylate cyclase (GGDEF)-like protein/PAS domain S-box-containing protein
MSDTIGLPVLGLLFEHSPDAALVVDESCVIRFANPALERLSGYPIADLVGQPLNRLLPEPIASQHDALVLQYSQHPGSSAILGRVREVTLRDRAGRLIPIDLKAVDLGVGGDERFFGAFMIDLQARKALEAEIQTLHARLEQEALTDALTGLPNRRAFDAEAIRAMARAQRDGTQTLCAILDIDHFGALKERLGGSAADGVLRILARSVQVAMRATDFFARIGSEEFGWLLPRITIEQAVPAVERIREAVATTEMSLAGRSGITVTISAGLTLLDPTQPLAASLERAGAALHRAKEQGLNRLIVR